MHRCEKHIRFSYIWAHIFKHSQDFPAYAQIYSSTHKMLQHMHYIQALTRFSYICTDILKQSLEFSNFVQIYLRKIFHKYIQAKCFLIYTQMHLSAHKLCYIITAVCKYSQKCFTYAQLYANTHKNILHVHSCMQILTKKFHICTAVCKYS